MALRPPAAAPKVNTDCGERARGPVRAQRQLLFQAVPGAWAAGLGPWMVVSLLSPEGYKRHADSCSLGMPQQRSAVALSSLMFKCLAL